MFTSIIDSTTASLTTSSVLICFAAAIVLGLLVAVLYMKCSEKYSKGFVVTLALLPILVEAVIMMTSGNLGSAVAVMGAFSLIRFRSATGTAKEILSIFFSMAIGLACGMGQILFAMLLALVVAVVFLVLMKSPFGEEPTLSRKLKVRIPEELDYTEVFDDLFEKYTTKVELMKARTVNLGSMYDLEYQVILKDARMEKAFMDDIRVRNGNLEISMAKKSELRDEL